MVEKERDIYLEIHVRDESKLVEVWLTGAEGRDGAVLEGLKPLYREYGQNKYLVVVFRSGGEDLCELTQGLLCSNQQRSAQREVERERQMTMG